jgi:apolipoprotein N-acyltransferase
MRYPHSHLATGSAAFPRALVARRALLGAVLLGILADPLLRNGPWGLGLLVWMVVFATTAIVLVRQNRRPLSAESSIWLAVAVLFAGGLSWRDAAMLQFFDVLAMLSALVLLAMSIDAIPVPGLALARVRDLIRAAF